MSAVLKPMTLEACLYRENQQELKHEFDGFQPVAMTGVSHRCQPHGGDLKVQAAGRIRYPDAFIVRAPVSSETLVVRDPVVVFEIISPSTSDKDHFEKNLEYK